MSEIQIRELASYAATKPELVQNRTQLRCEDEAQQSMVDEEANLITGIQDGFRKTHHSRQEVKINIPLTETERQNLTEIKALLDQDLDDGLFVQHIEELRGKLPRVFGQMEGMSQTPPHEDIDPVDHTLNALSLLNTRDLSSEDRQAARATLLFHDVGKVYDSLDRDHPRRSPEIATLYLEAMGYKAPEQNRILQQIEWHDALGDIARRDGFSIFDPHDVREFFPTIQDLALHKAIAMADVQSIPQLQKYVGNLEAVHRLMENRAYAERKWIEPMVNQTLPFEKIPESEITGYQKYWLKGKFDEVDINQHMQQRDANFTSLPPHEQQRIKQAIIQSAMENKRDLLSLLQITGRETDRTFVTQLEAEFHLNLDNIRISQEVFAMTYLLWQLNKDVKKANPSNEKEITAIKRKLQEVLKSSHFLSAYEVEATHATVPEAEAAIDESQSLIRSDAGESSHYEGNGIYTGIIGSYREWNRKVSFNEYQTLEESGKIYKMKVPLADGMPIISGFEHPQAMVNMLGEVLHIKDEGDQVAVTHGLRQWYQTGFNPEETTEWKLKIIGELLGGNPFIVKDEHNEPCVVMDTDKDAIMWGPIMRGLRIRRFIPLSEISKTNLPDIKPKKEIDYDAVANTIRTIRGVTRKDLPEY